MKRHLGPKIGPVGFQTGDQRAPWSVCPTLISLYQASLAQLQTKLVGIYWTSMACFSQQSRQTHDRQKAELWYEVVGLPTVRDVDEAASEPADTQITATRVMGKYATLQQWEELVRQGSPDDVEFSPDFTGDYRDTRSAICGDKIAGVLGCAVPPGPNAQTPTGLTESSAAVTSTGVMDGEAILGGAETSVPGGRSLPAYVDDDEMGRTQHGGSQTARYPTRLPPEWAADRNGRGHAPPTLTSAPEVRNTRTSEIVNSDPRLFPDALRAGGVSTQRISLVYGRRRRSTN
ncbi:hypothetical protein F4778DRAFT_786567 [Xylariomycetidae sp. FL2044]|nr:hypothetical protein F4778DRAFT_786567 [Xylariomycetidae sp. FL2044]